MESVQQEGLLLLVCFHKIRKLVTQITVVEFKGEASVFQDWIESVFQDWIEAVFQDWIEADFRDTD
ncbi:hypothetical protein [Flaviaesturariibacter terrae]